LLLSAGACCTAPAAVDRYILPAERSATNPLAAVAAVDRVDRTLLKESSAAVDRVDRTLLKESSI